MRLGHGRFKPAFVARFLVGLTGWMIFRLADLGTKGSDESYVCSFRFLEVQFRRSMAAR
jgi:hypothetical protein